MHHGQDGTVQPARLGSGGLSGREDRDDKASLNWGFSFQEWNGSPPAKPLRGVSTPSPRHVTLVIVDNISAMLRHSEQKFGRSTGFRPNWIGDAISGLSHRGKARRANIQQGRQHL